MKLIKFQLPDLMIPATNSIKVRIKKLSKDTGQIEINMREKEYAEMISPFKK